jgi:hypothetical protein
VREGRCRSDRTQAIRVVRDHLDERRRVPTPLDPVPRDLEHIARVSISPAHPARASPERNRWAKSEQERIRPLSGPWNRKPAEPGTTSAGATSFAHATQPRGTCPGTRALAPDECEVLKA